jgi:hypothetical protein
VIAPRLAASGFELIRLRANAVHNRRVPSGRNPATPHREAGLSLGNPGRELPCDKPSVIGAFPELQFSGIKVRHRTKTPFKPRFSAFTRFQVPTDSAPEKARGRPEH